MLLNRAWSRITPLWRGQSCRTIITEINSLDQYHGLLKQKNEELVVIQFSAEWCGPCRKMKPFVEKCSSDMKGTSFFYVDIDANTSIAEEADITSVPTFHLVRNGAVLNKLIGADPERLEETIKKSLSDK